MPVVLEGLCSALDVSVLVDDARPLICGVFLHPGLPQTLVASRSVALRYLCLSRRKVVFILCPCQSWVHEYDFVFGRDWLGVIGASIVRATLSPPACSPLQAVRGRGDLQVPNEIRIGLLCSCLLDSHFFSGPHCHYGIRSS